jgi:hypothetical protein
MIKNLMKVLFIAPKFFNYEQEIKLEMERQGYQVDWFDDRPSSSTLTKALIRFNPNLVSSYSDAYFTRIIEGAQSVIYDIVFVLKGEALSVEILELLRKKQKKARFLYYTYDSLKNYKNIIKKLAYFDKAYSFDRSDVSCHSKIIYLPLFYTKSYENLTVASKKYDFLLLASIHSDRYVVAERIFNEVNSKSLGDLSNYSYFYYQSQWVFLLMKLFNPQFKKIPWKSVSWKALTHKETINLVQSSRILIDIHHPGQNGLTMRTIECLGARKKLITTNEDVKNHDFYCADNILVVNRENPEVNENFVTSKYKSIDMATYNKYSLQSWVQEIFS